MEIITWYQDNFESSLKGRYITSKDIFPLVNSYRNRFEVSHIGLSELGLEIPLLKIGNGRNVILAWSQMHGNESTTTKALFDIFKFFAQADFFQKEILQFLENNSFYIIPMLNPDGAQSYTRENANGIDLNRDAQNLSQSESRCLRSLFDDLQPDLCLNMHDQRSIYGFENGLPATISFLSPAADAERSLTPERIKAMEGILTMEKFLNKLIPGQIGRYDDSFNPNCVGDTFQMSGMPTILFEAGHSHQDYNREKSREYVFYGILALFNIIGDKESRSYNQYFEIPQNLKNYCDLIIRNIHLKDYTHPVDIAIQYKELLTDGNINFIPELEEIGNLNYKFGHKEVTQKFLQELTKNENLLTNNVKVSEILEIWRGYLSLFH